MTMLSTACGVQQGRVQSECSRFLSTHWPLQKLASLMELDQATLRQQLTCLKAKSYSLQWTGGADATQGKLCVNVYVLACVCVYLLLLQAEEIFLLVLAGIRSFTCAIISSKTAQPASYEIMAPSTLSYQ
jgi:hypothetical protein